MSQWVGGLMVRQIDVSTRGLHQLWLQKEFPAMRSLGFGDQSRKELRKEGGFELVLERWELGQKGKRAHSRLGRSMGKCLTTIWGRRRWRTRGGQTHRQVPRTGGGKWCEIQDVFVGDTQIMRGCKKLGQEGVCSVFDGSGAHWRILSRQAARNRTSMQSCFLVKVCQVPRLLMKEVGSISIFFILKYCALVIKKLLGIGTSESTC